jgi:hypothetical protein
LFIPEVIHEHEETWWNDIDRGTLLIRPPELSGKPTSTHLVAKENELGEGNYEFGLTKYPFSYFAGIF